MDEYIAKPLRRETLENVLRRALPAPPASCEATIVDHSLLEEIDADSAERIVELFLTTARARIAELAEAARERDVETISQVSHGLKGAAASVGAVAMCRACDELSAGAHAGSADQTWTALTQLDRALAQTESILSLQPEKGLR